MFENIPDELKNLDQWVLWRRISRDNGKSIKMPFQANGSAADPSNVATGTSFDRVLTTYNQGGYAGIGFIFSKDDPYIGIDLDHCMKDGVTMQWAVALQKRFPTYTEVTPSGEGLHIIGKGKLEDGGRNCSPIEIYDKGRYFTFTGNALNGNQIEDIQIYARKLYNGLKPLSMAIQQRGKTFSNLLNGEYPKYSRSGQVDRSKADWGFVSDLIVVGATDEEITEIYELSQLAREKWWSRRGSSTYGQITINFCRKKNNKPLDKINHDKIDLILENPDILDDKATRKYWKKKVRSAKEKFLHRDIAKDFKAVEELIKGLEREVLLMDNPIIDMADLVCTTDEDHYWLLEGLIPTTGLTLLSGPPKCGKSTMARHIAWCVANGEDFLNFKNHNPGPVLWITSDENKADLREGFRRTWRGSPKHKIYSRLGWFDDFEDFLDDVVQELPEKPVLVVLDTLASGLKANDFNSYAEMMGRLAMINATLESLKIPLLALSHTRKGYGNGPTKGTSFEDILGSAAIRGSMSSLILLSRYSIKQPQCLHMSLEGRNVESVSNQLMIMDYQKSRIRYATEEDQKEYKKVNSKKSIDELKIELLDMIYAKDGYVPTYAEARDWLKVEKEISNQVCKELWDEGIFQGNQRNRILNFPVTD